METLHDILAATDFSDDGSAALRRAAMLGAELGLERGRAVHVIEPSVLATLRGWLGRDAAAVSEAVASARGRLESETAELAGATGFSLEAQIRTGRVVHELAEAAAETDLMVLGAHGSSRLREVALGSVPSRLLTRCSRSMLVVRRDPETAYRRVVVGVDFSDCSVRALAMARALAPEAVLHPMHVFEYPHAAAMYYASVPPEVVARYRDESGASLEAELTRFLADQGALGERCVPQVASGDAALTLRDQAVELGADLVVVGRRGTDLIEDLLIGSVTQRILSVASCDILVAR